MALPVRAPQHLFARLRHGLAAAGLGLLAACGGGSDSDAGNTNIYNVDAALSRVLQNGLQINGLTGSAGGVSFTLSMVFTPQDDAVFEGVQRKAVRQTITISGGGSSETTTGVSYFAVAKYADHGAAYDDGSIDVSVPTGELPTAGRVGSSGPLSTTTSYASTSKQQVTATGTTTWSLEPDSSSTALACLRTELLESGSATPLTGRQCFRLNTAGDVQGARVTVSQGSTSIEFR